AVADTLHNITGFVDGVVHAALHAVRDVLDHALGVNLRAAVLASTGLEDRAVRDHAEPRAVLHGLADLPDHTVDRFVGLCVGRSEHVTGGLGRVLHQRVPCRGDDVAHA